MLIKCVIFFIIILLLNKTMIANCLFTFFVLLMRVIPEDKIFLVVYIYNKQTFESKTQCNHRRLSKIGEIKKDFLSCLNKYNSQLLSKILLTETKL